MSPRETQARDAGLQPEAVVEFLQQNPHFLREHPTLLAELDLPHARGDAVSLWDRQQTQLREENRQLRAQAAGFMASARGNERLIGKIHSLTLALIAARGPRAVLDLLARDMAEDFEADHLSVLVFAPPPGNAEDLPEFVGPTAAPRRCFDAQLQQHETLCGQLTATQQRALFGRRGFAGSHVVLPLRGPNWDGLLVVSSRDPSRFDARMGTDFLAFLRDVITLVMTPFIEAP